jgi:hypothetical protein
MFFYPEKSKSTNESFKSVADMKTCALSLKKVKSMSGVWRLHKPLSDKEVFLRHQSK